MRHDYNYQMRAKKLLGKIYPYVKEDFEKILMIRRAVVDFNRKNHMDVELTYGSARVCLMYEDFVIKWDYDEDSVFEIGGCDDEYEEYKVAFGNGWSYLLAETSQVNIKGKHFNIMPRVQVMGYQAEKDLYDYVTEEEKEILTRYGNDLHDWNWGLIDGEPRIIDYAFTDNVAERSHQEDEEESCW